MKANAPSSMDMEDIASLQEENARLREELRKLESQNQDLKDHEIKLQNTLSELRESEQRFRLLVSGVKDYAIFMLTPEGNIASWNEGAQRIKGYSADEIIGRHFSTFYTEEDILDGKPPRELRIAIKEGKYEEEGWRVRKDGSVFWANVLITAIWDENGKLVGFAKVTRDLTERKQSQEALMKKNLELASSNAELEQFAYVASHDLQEPLRTAATYVQLLEKRYRDKLDDAANDYIDFIVESTRRMRTLINDLLEYSRVGRSSKNVETVDLNKVVDAIKGIFSSALMEMHGEIVHSQLPCIASVPVYMQQLFQNLIGNALKFHKPNMPPRVEIRAERSNGYWQFSVKDNGIGIDPQFKDRIFLIFQRLHTRDVYPGSGIGLSICKKIIDLHGGKIWFESKLGQGTTFYFTLPG